MALLAASDFERFGFPPLVEGPMSWDGKIYEDKANLYVQTLCAQEVMAINEALSHFKGLGLSRGFLSTDTFPLPKALSDRLRCFVNEVNTGRGFVVLRGLDPSVYSEEDIIAIYAGVTSHVASDRATFVDHIRYNKKEENAGELLRPTELAAAMNFHTDADAGNILTMFTISKSQQGGDQYLSSFWRIYNELIIKHPALLATLADDWYWEKPNRANSGQTTDITHRPIIACADGKPQINFGSSFVAGHPKYPLREGAPTLEDNQREALDTLLALARKFSFKLSQETGDILFVNNLSIMHAREEFHDNVATDQGRHLVRLWLQDKKQGWNIADSLHYEHKNLYNTDPDSQKLLTLSEWSAMARVERLAGVGITCSHD